MIWSHPWIAVATAPGGTKLPPPAPGLDVRWRATRVHDLTNTELEDWGSFVRTGWGGAALRERLENSAIIVRVVDERNEMRATCVLRPRGGGLWILETLVARPTRAGWGSKAMHAGIRAAWEHGARGVGFVWELGLRGLTAAWWRGWMVAAVSVEWGWMWRRPDSSACGFCPNTAAWLPPASGVPVRPVVVRGDGWSVIVSDSGLFDGWGHILAVSGDRQNVNWERVSATGGWRDLWWVGGQPLPGWRWTGEAVVRGVLNWGGASVSPESWITAEITSG
jgi:hypothetical protein